MSDQADPQSSCAGTLTQEPGVYADPDLLARGWVRRYLADRGRAQEAQALYESLGLEVLLQAPAPKQLALQCTGCRETACTSYFMIYTRRT